MLRKSHGFYVESLLRSLLLTGEGAVMMQIEFASLVGMRLLIVAKNYWNELLLQV